MKELLDLIPKKYKTMAFCVFVIALFGSWCITHGNELKNIWASFQNPDAKVMIDSTEHALNLGGATDLTIQIYPVGIQKLPQGTISISSSSDAMKVIPVLHSDVESIEGSKTISNLKIRAIKESDEPIAIYATYRTGELTKKSNVLSIKILPKAVELKPHFDITDTKRVVLSGTWETVLGADSGELRLRQSDGKISGSYSFPSYKWPSGKIEGITDGNTYRIKLFIPYKKVEERLWLAGDYVLHKESGSIQMHGCAYHLRRMSDQRAQVGSQGIDCSISVKIPGWKTLQADSFMATASFDFETAE
ncbi:hypothetical protein [Pseudomonas saponiphila]|uniref:hypothetical protein n=1 Tax=Pseudomonas saponiphila TaxID=556534 RepID=UPI00224083AD|nr:hypothetical protein [Pseudomonas saponiphila]